MQQDEVQKKANQEEKQEEVIKESDFLFDKTYTCPACDTEFKVKECPGRKGASFGGGLQI